MAALAAALAEAAVPLLGRPLLLLLLLVASARHHGNSGEHQSFVKQFLLRARDALVDRGAAACCRSEESCAAAIVVDAPSARACVTQIDVE